MAWTNDPDGTITDDEGKVVFFSAKRFVNDICRGNCCFICGAQPGSKPFNDEHILPEWLLRHFNLFSRTVSLPNGVAVRYDRYTIPCCADCNSLMGKEIETPVSEALKGGVESLNDFLQNGHAFKLFVWMGLIFLKTHLKDRAHRVHLDRREGDQLISDQYDWSDLHHIHCVVRCFYTGCEIAKEVVGSCIVLPARDPKFGEKFDFADLYASQSMLLRVGELAIVVVFDDAGGAMSYFHRVAERFSCPLSEIQLREVLSELAFLNLHLKNRPEFRTECDGLARTCRIVADLPRLELQDLDRSVRGKLLMHSLSDVLPHIRANGKSDQELRSAIESGVLSFLFDDSGEFVEKDWEVLEE